MKNLTQTFGWALIIIGGMILSYTIARLMSKAYFISRLEFFSKLRRRKDYGDEGENEIDKEE